MSSPNSPATQSQFELMVPPKIRVPSSQSVDSRMSSADAYRDYDELPPVSPIIPPADPSLELMHTSTRETLKVDLSCRGVEDMSAQEDGPVFRATMKALEQKTGNMRARMKKVLKKAEAARMAQMDCNKAYVEFMDALKDASTSNANAVQPALDYYFSKIAQEILNYEELNTVNLQQIIIEPITKLYQIDIKQAESKKRDFEEESKDFYAYVSRYLGQRQDSRKEKKIAESDTKYQTKRRNFELKRFDYSSFMQDLHGGRKEQEVLSHLTRYADAQTTSYLDTAKKVQELVPQLEALSTEVKEADKEFQYRRTEREEKRRMLENSTKSYVEPDAVPSIPAYYQTGNGNANGSPYNTRDSELGRADSTSSQLRAASANGAALTASPSSAGALVPGSADSSGGPLVSPGNQKFRGIRDMEEKDYGSMNSSEKNNTQRKEGLLWALSRPGSHVDPKGLNKQAWHKYVTIPLHALLS